MENPEAFFKHVWGNDIYLWDKLKEITQSVVENKRTTVQSGHGVGKSWLMARLAIWFLYCYRPAKVITTAPTWTQVEKILWGEIRTAYAKARTPLGGRLLGTELHLDTDTMAVGISTSETVENREYGSTRMQGFHSPNMLFILDEGAGVSKEIWTAASSLLTGENNKIVAIGNPASPTGPFFDTFSSPIWHPIKISCEDHPNVRENRMVVPGCVTREWIEERAIEWGVESPLYKAKVLGEFPDEGTDTLFPLSVVQSAVDREVTFVEASSYGIDVARFGDDETTIFKCNGMRFIMEKSMAKSATTDVSGFIMGQSKIDYHIQNVAVDDTGVGGGVTDQLNAQDPRFKVLPINFGEASSDPETFFNLKAELFWKMSLDFKAEKISIEDDPVLISQLTSIRYFFTPKGQIRIESKDDMKKRGLKSPDRADGLVICYSTKALNSGKLSTVRSAMLTANLMKAQF